MSAGYAWLAGILSFIVYCVVGVVVGSLSILTWGSNEDVQALKNGKYFKDFGSIWGIISGIFWPIALPIWLLYQLNAVKLLKYVNIFKIGKYIAQAAVMYPPQEEKGSN